MPLQQFCETVVNGIHRQTPREFAGQATSNSSGKVIFNMTEDGTATGEALFKESVIMETIAYCDFQPNRVIKCTNPVVSADRKTLTMDVKQNASLLSLGLLPFEQAATGVVINMRVQGV